MTTEAPSFASAFAMAKPIPAVDPVTRARLPSSCRSMGFRCPSRPSRRRIGRTEFAGQEPWCSNLDFRVILTAQNRTNRQQGWPSLPRSVRISCARLGMIEARELGKVFNNKKRGEIRAVDSVSFSCKPGEIYGLLGANGAGKTTTLRMLATILFPTSGTARVAGFDIVDQPQEVRANVGFLSTATALYGRLTAREMVEYFGRLNGMEGEVLKSALNSLFDVLGMNEFRDRQCD